METSLWSSYDCATRSSRICRRPATTAPAASGRMEMSCTSPMRATIASTPTTCPTAIDARLASLSLSGVDIGEFDRQHAPSTRAIVDEGVTETTVEAEAPCSTARRSSSTRPTPMATTTTVTRSIARGAGGDHRVRDVGRRDAAHACTAWRFETPTVESWRSRPTWTAIDLAGRRTAAPSPRPWVEAGHPRQGDRHLSVGRGHKRLAGLLPRPRGRAGASTPCPPSAPATPTGSPSPSPSPGPFSRPRSVSPVPLHGDGLSCPGVVPQVGQHGCASRVHSQNRYRYPRF